MTPGLAFFYGGLVKATSVVSMMMLSFGSHGPRAPCSGCLGNGLRQHGPVRQAAARKGRGTRISGTISFVADRAVLPGCLRSMRLSFGHAARRLTQFGRAARRLSCGRGPHQRRAAQSHLRCGNVRDHQRVALISGADRRPRPLLPVDDLRGSVRDTLRLLPGRCAGWVLLAFKNGRRQGCPDVHRLGRHSSAGHLGSRRPARSTTPVGTARPHQRAVAAALALAHRPRQACQLQPRAQASRHNVPLVLHRRSRSCGSVGSASTAAPRSPPDVPRHQRARPG